MTNPVSLLLVHFPCFSIRLVLLGQVFSFINCLVLFPLRIFVGVFKLLKEEGYLANGKKGNEQEMTVAEGPKGCKRARRTGDLMA